MRKTDYGVFYVYDKTMEDITEEDWQFYAGWFREYERAVTYMNRVFMEKNVSAVKVVERNRTYKDVVTCSI